MGRSYSGAGAPAIATLPGGLVQFNQGDTYCDQTNKNFYFCTTSGTSSVAAWQKVGVTGSPPIVGAVGQKQTFTDTLEDTVITWSMPGGTLGANGRLSCYAMFRWQNTNVSNAFNLTLKFYVNSALIVPPLSVGASSEFDGWVEFVFFNQNAQNSNSSTGTSYLVTALASNAWNTATVRNANGPNSSIDTSATQTVKLTSTWSAGTGNITATYYNSMIVVYPSS